VPPYLTTRVGSRETGTMSQSLTSGLRLLRGLVPLVATCLALAVPAISDAEVPEIDASHMSELVEWVYRNGAGEDPDPCHSECEALWSAQHAIPHPGNIWTGFSETMLGTGLWGSVSELEIPNWPLHAGPSSLGLKIDGPSPKWMALPVPAAYPPDPRIGCAETSASLERAGYVWQPSFEPGSGGAMSELAAPAWVLNTCFANAVNEWDELTAGGLSYCVGTAHYPVSAGEWAEHVWAWNHCAVDTLAGGTFHYEEVAQLAQGLSTHVKFGVVEPFAGQPFAVALGLPHDPGSTVIRERLEKALGEPSGWGEWLKWVLGGEHGPDPVGTVPTLPEHFGSGGGGGAGGVTGTGDGPKHECHLGHSVNCATGNEAKTQTDLGVGGRGPGLTLMRTYNSQLAVSESAPGPFGYGWSDPYAAHVEVDHSADVATVTLGDGSEVRFAQAGSGWAPVSRLALSTLTQEGELFVLTTADQTKLRFGASGYLASETDRNGNAVTIHGTEGRPESVSDAAGRSLSFSYEGGLLHTVTDPLGHTVTYAYEGGNLATVTEPGETGPRWRFKYNAAHEMTAETDGRGYTTEREYDGSNRVESETDPLHRKRIWEYSAPPGSEGEITTITEPNGATTREEFNTLGEPTSVTRAYGTSLAATERNTYDEEGHLLNSVNPDGYPTTYTYDEAGNLTSEQNADGDKTEWTYDSTHDVLTTTTPLGETTTVERDSHGNATSVSRPAPGGAQRTRYKYDSQGDLESITYPLERTWKYGYDSYGDRTSETDPEGDKHTMAFDTDSKETSSVSANGHVIGAKESKFTTTIERDPQGRIAKVTDALGHETKYTYDAAGNLEAATDPEKNVTHYTYNAEDEPTRVEEPDGTTTETAYDTEGAVESQTNGDKQTTKYVRNSLEEPAETLDPLGRITARGYDAAGNLTTLKDAEGRTTSYAYDPASRLTGVNYSDGTTHAVSYEYDADGDRVAMSDATGTSTFAYDQLQRLTASTDGHGDSVDYEYDLANEHRKITYPNGKAVTRTYDNAGRLKTVTDWNEHTTTFAYDADSNLKATSFPTETADEDAYAYDEADHMHEVKMTKGSEVLALLVYARNKDDLVTKATTTGLPGEEKPAFSYDESNRLTKGAGIKYAYDAANNLTTIGPSTNTYDSAGELEAALQKKATTATYHYDEDGQRTKTEPTAKPATTYGYDQAGNLTTVSRPKGTEEPAIEDAYDYNGEGLRAAEDIAGTTNYLTWDASDEVPLLLNDGAYSYVFGPAGLPVEQITGSGGVLYLHHDQQGSTRLATGEAGKVEASYTYSGYGELLGHTGVAKAPLGYDAQYTSTDTGLIYLRTRAYDPATAQFLSVDPAVPETRARYNYAQENPVAGGDPTGRCPGFGPSVAGCEGGASELAPNLFCEPTVGELRSSEQERIRSEEVQRQKDSEKLQHEFEKIDEERELNELWGEGEKSVKREVEEHEGGEPEAAVPTHQPNA
jgi:RHS repeat-associated protein